MRLDASTRGRLRLQGLAFLSLFGAVIGLLAWLSVRYPFQADWTAGARNTLSTASQTLLSRLDGPVRVTAYARDHPSLRDGIHRLVGRYQRHKSDLTLDFVNPDTLPEQVRQLGITLNGELYLEYRGRGEKVLQLSEQAFTHALQRLSRRQHRTAVFLEGHGERKPLGAANYDLGTFGRELEKTGVQVRSLHPAVTPHIPADTAALVIAGPQTPLSPDEVQAILEYVDQGGNLLWLLDPNGPAGLAGLQPLAAALGISILPGVVLDADAPTLGIQNPAFIPIADYGPHPITASLRSPALLPLAAALDFQPQAGWQSAVLLESQSRTWTETGPFETAPRFNPETAGRSGPLTVGMALFRLRPGAKSQQRLVVIGDGDFLSNTYLGNGANLELGLNILNWLTLDDVLIAIPPRVAPDPTLALSDRTLALLAALFLIGLPALLLGSGWLIWLRRRRR